MIRAILYSAVSSKGQATDDKISVARQLELGRQHADKWNMTVVGELVIPGVSRSISLFERAARTVKGYYIDEQGNRHDVFVYAKMLELVEARPRPFDVLIFLNRSRLGRKASLSMTVIELCEENGVKPYDMESPPRTLDIDGNQDERLIGAFHSVRAQREVELLSAAREAGMAQRVKKGYFSTRIPFGYKPQYDERKHVTYIVDQQATDTILLIHKYYMEDGLGTPAIAEKLTELGRPAPSGQKLWRKQTVSYLLGLALTYAGFVEWQGQDYVIAPGRHDAIISEERARAILAERDARIAVRRSTGATYRFSRMIRCATCNGPAYVSSYYSERESKSGTKRYYHEYYICPQHGGLSGRKIHKWLTNLIGQMTDDAIRRNIVGDAADVTPALLAEITMYEQQIKDIERKLRLAEDAMFDGDISRERYRERKAQFDAQLAENRREIAQIQRTLADTAANATRSQHAEELVATGLAMLATPDLRSANAWLRQRIRINISSGKVISATLF